MMNQNINYGEKTANATSYIKKFENTYDIYNKYNKYNTTFRGQGTLSCFVKTINPSKYNGIFVKTFNNYKYRNNS
jgi:uncharacterized protein YhfF